MIIGQIENGIVLDHITAGHGMEIYEVLGLGKLDCMVALIKNAESVKMGKKDIIKIDEVLDLDLDIIGYIDPGVTVNYIRGGERVKRVHLQLPEEVRGVIRCKNPRCITSVEQEIEHVFRLTDKENRVYRCIYCDTKAGK
ncbi:MAG: aspartate carbamoyltransferase regulatory subunit [Clostridia bacterium]|nr:aspartate carbamoyltransferase regulatory subunit [Clostridia bacterium]MBR6773013.1 aspartate carbamoyltransferase regulatory subunit [Clostridia bacterium]